MFHEASSIPTPSLSPDLSSHPSANDPISTPPSSSGPGLGSGSPVHDTPPALADTAGSQLSSHRAICDPSPSTNGSLPSPVTSVLSGLNSTPASIGQAEQAHRPIVALGVSEKSLAKATSALKAKLLNKAISQLQIEHEEKVMDLANTHGVTVSRVKKLAGTSKHHRKRRVNSAQDAILHAKSTEMNEGRRYKAKIGEIRRAAELDDDLQLAKTDPDKLKILMDGLEEHQQAKKEVARTSNKAGAMKVTRLLQGFNSDFQELRGTTDIAGFGFFVRGSFESSIKPTIVGGGPVLEFFQKYFNKDPWEMACLFEAFVTTYNKVGSRKLLHSEKAKATSKTISESLARISGVDKIRMNYPNFRTKVSAKYKVKIIGWPTDVPLVSPRDITDPEKLNTLYDAWRSGSAYWSTMDKREYKKFMQQLDQDKAAGLEVEIPRKGRSDIGGRHRKATAKRPGENDAEEPPAKRKRTSSSTKPMHIREQHESDEGDENSDIGRSVNFARGSGDENENEDEDIDELDD
ncbi:MAG: hypothetical protein NXY57DRAFT_1043448 [Lentinula lateritia]|uniref:Uncharacterized protein n=1 Tax=Lentinula lateritia TaxID=40482 RepID=A0ABQ8VGY3_9AGAR|nr:MAG: hypothetical protein NXY57DRAFT_1043448 [Lentinula lateritia]KAJ4491651.1 hypothetical protein C8R41DRAFT_867517 [Lentinula lateritia]